MTIVLTWTTILQTLATMVLVVLTCLTWFSLIWWTDGVPREIRWHIRQWLPVGVMVLITLALWILWNIWVF